MSKGDIVKNEFKTFKDAYTGKLITRLTSEKYLSHHPYFQHKMVTNDGRYLIYSSNMDGIRNLYKMDLTDGTAIQLTEDKEDIFGCSARLGHDDKYLYFTRNDDVCRICLDTLEDEVVYKGEEEWSNWGQSFSWDDKAVLVTEIKKKDLIMAGDWDTFEPQWEAKPHCRFVFMDLKTKQRQVAFEDEHCWLSHGQIRPYDNDTILFCHEGPNHRIDARLWLVDRDGTNLRCPKPKKHQEEWLAHEYWLDDGTKYAYLFKDRVDSETATIFFADPKTMIEEKLMECSGYCHMISNSDNSKIVGDSDKFLYLVDVKEKREELLCYHGSSWKGYGTTQDAHPHPAFSPDGKTIIFTTDMEGIPCVYKVEL